MMMRSEDLEADEYAWMRWKLTSTTSPTLLDQAEPDRIWVNPTVCPPVLKGFPLLVDDETGEVNEPVLLFLWSEHVAANGSFCDNTVWSYGEDLKDWFRFLDTINVKWTNARLTHIDSYSAVMERTKSPHTGKVYASATINRRLATVNSFYAWARADGFVASIPLVQPDSLKKDLSGKAPPAPKKAMNDFVLGPAFSALEDKGFSRHALKRKTVDVKASDEDDDSGVVKVLLPKQSADLFAALGPKPSQNVGQLQTQPDEALYATVSKVSSRDRLASEISYHTGVRIDENKRLKVGQFTKLNIEGLDAGADVKIIVVGKGSKKRTIDFPVFLIAEIQLYIRTERRLAAATKGPLRNTQQLLVNGFPTGKRHAGNPTSVRTIQRCFASACLRAGLTMSQVETPEKLIPAFWFHCLRHTYAVVTYYTRKRIDAEPWKYIQEQLGHRYVTTTQSKYLAATATYEAGVSNRYMKKVNG
jgi:site-specific recombinase XerD